MSGPLQIHLLVFQGLPCPLEPSPQGFPLVAGQLAQKSLDTAILFFGEGFHFLFQRHPSFRCVQLAGRLFQNSLWAFGCFFLAPIFFFALFQCLALFQGFGWQIGSLPFFGNTFELWAFHCLHGFAHCPFSRFPCARMT